MILLYWHTQLQIHNHFYKSLKQLQVKGQSGCPLVTQRPNHLLLDEVQNPGTNNDLINRSIKKETKLSVSNVTEINGGKWFVMKKILSHTFIVTFIDSAIASWMVGKWMKLAV